MDKRAPGELRSDAEWKAWGRIDPLWGVASWPGKERGSATPWTDEEFYALGSDWKDFDNAWKRLGRELGGIALEIGCGAGRITRLMAESFEHVIATDISEDVMDYAQTHLSLSNVEWRKSNGGSLPAADSSVNAVFSCHVLQHLPNQAAQLEVFRDVFRVLTPGGSFFIHLPMHAWPENQRLFTEIVRKAHLAFKKLMFFKIRMQEIRLRIMGKPYMRGTSHELAPLIASLTSMGFAEVSVTVITVRASDTLHFCVFGKKY